MIRPFENDTKNTTNTFHKNRYVVIDNILDPIFASECQSQILSAHDNCWDRYNNCFEQKYTFRDKTLFPESVKQLFDYLVSEHWINRINKLSGLTLLNDEDRIFWGIHMFENGDNLDIHVDAGRHIKTGYVKAITVGFYLSYNWKSENEGYLEFWRGDASYTSDPKIYECIDKTLPMFNRMVIFENNDFSWHGSPDKCICNNDEKRIFVTISYLCLDTELSQFKNNRKKAFFIKRPGDPDDLEKDKMRLLRANPESCHKIYNVDK